MAMLRDWKGGVARLGDRYGHTGTAAILVCMALLAAVPFPGTCLLPLCVAELALRGRGPQHL